MEKKVTNRRKFLIPVPNPQKAEFKTETPIKER